MKSITAVLCLLFASAACTVTMRHERVNVGQFQVGCPATQGNKKIENSKSQGPDGFLAVINGLKVGMNEAEVAGRFCHKSMGEIPNTKVLNGEEICRYLGGGSFGCAAAGSAIKMPIPVHYSAYAIPLKDARHLVSPTARSGGGAVMKDRGYNLNFVPIFEDGKLLVAFREGTQVINGEHRAFIWTVLGAQAGAQTRKAF